MISVGVYRDPSCIIFERHLQCQEDDQLSVLLDLAFDDLWWTCNCQDASEEEKISWYRNDVLARCIRALEHGRTVTICGICCRNDDELFETLTTQTRNRGVLLHTDSEDEVVIIPADWIS